ncbi:MAG TPA: aldehyde dehydrogenase family protein, partial [Paraburkholderia sp.]|nr:aldehyde dehydrogenase family protein [Paraburkholderia sp.]
MAALLENFVAGKWVAGQGDGALLVDPVTGEALARVSSDGLNFSEAFDYARRRGGTALRELSYAARAALLAEVVKVLQANRDDYYAIALANSGTTKNDSAVDID